MRELLVVDAWSCIAEFSSIQLIRNANVLIGLHVPRVMVALVQETRNTQLVHSQRRNFQGL